MASKRANRGEPVKACCPDGGLAPFIYRRVKSGGARGRCSAEGLSLLEDPPVESRPPRLPEILHPNWIEPS